MTTTSRPFKILGREPAFFAGVVEAVLALLLTFGIPGLDQDRAGVIVAATTALLGLVVAYATRTTLFSALVGFAKAVLVLAVTFGAPLTDAQTGSIMALIVLVASSYLRDRTSPTDTPLTTPARAPGATRNRVYTAKPTDTTEEA